MTENEIIWQIQLLQDGRTALGDLIAHLERSPLLDVASYSGETTWQGPTPDAFNETDLGGTTIRVRIGVAF